MIASRVLRVKTDAGEVDLPIHIFAPRPSGGAFACRFEIHWPHGVKAMDAAGHDAVQALCHALEMVGIHLYTSDYHADGDLLPWETWKGYGFPVPRNLRDMLLPDDAKYM